MSNTYNIELCPAILTPFEWSTWGATSVPTSGQTNALSGYGVGSADESGLSTGEIAQAAHLATSTGMDIGYFPNATTTNTPTTAGLLPQWGHPLFPLYQTGGLVFPYNPTISESLGIRYDVTELVHANENIHAYKNTDNVRLTLSECVWTSETWDQAIYTCLLYTSPSPRDS